MSQTADGKYYTSDDDLSLYYRDFSPEMAGIPVICLPGLTRNSRDFEDLALYLSDRCRVLTPDLRGRGFSQHDPEWRNYHPGTYVRDVWRLLDQLSIDRVVVIGTSLGGLIAMALAGQNSSRLAGVIMNDIGPEVAPAGLARVQNYTGRLPPVGSWDEAIAQTREIYDESLPGLSEADWEKLARRAYREGDDGVPRIDMDPEIGRAVREVGPTIADPWQLFRGLAETPTMVLRGALSDILSPGILARMLEIKPDLEVVEVPNRGHVPLLDEPECLAAIDKFLAGI